MMPHSLPGAAATGRRRTTVELVPALGPLRRVLVLLAATGLGYAALLVCAAAQTAVGLVVAAAAVAGAEVAAARRGQFQTWALRQAGFGSTARGALRGVALVLFAALTTGTALAVTVAVAVVAVSVARAVQEGAAQAVELLRTPPIASRNLALDLPAPPAAPAAWLSRPDGWTAALELVMAAGLAAAASGPDWLGLAGGLVAVIGAGLGPLALLQHLLRLRRYDVRPRVAAAVEAALEELRPEVVAYLANGAEWRYQLEMWLETLEAVDRRVLLLVRDHEVLQTLAPTELPVVSVTRGAAMMQLPLPGARVALYVGNGAYNVHLLRRTALRSAFIGHGDSDKGASANPFARAYDEVWVAGPAGRDRYAAAGVELPPTAFVEVGRPQLRELPRRPEPDDRLSVLYAPTWEGWGEDPFHSSLPHVGPDIVRALLERGDVRVMYRPHPRTGHRDAATQRAHVEILRLMQSAGARLPAATDLGRPPSTGPAPRGDVLDQLVAPPARWSRAEHEAAVAKWTDAFWAAHPGHRILTAPAPDLHSCFEMADALIADISSVPTDFLATNRPYGIVNCTGIPAAEFRARSATARGGFVLGGDLVGLDELVSAAGLGPDPTAAAREQARTYLLGPRTADPAARFRQELDRLCGETRPVG